MTRVAVALTGAAASTSADTYYPFLGNASSALNLTTQANAQTQIDVAGVASGVWLYLTSNASANAGTLYLQVNGSNVNLSISIPATTTGYLENLVSYDNIAAGDLVNFFFDRGAGGGSVVAGVGAWFDSSGNNLVAGAFTTATTVSTASTTFEFVDTALLRTSGIGLNGRIPARAAYTASRLQVYVSVNARTTDTILRLRKNAANGNQIITIPAGTTGMLMDVTNSDSFVAGNELDYTVTTGTGTGNFTMTFIGSQKTGTSLAYQLQNMVVVGQGWNSTSPVYIHPSGGLTPTITEAVTQLEMRGSGAISLFQVRLSANAANAQVQYIVNKNGTNTALLVTFAAAASGTVLDSTNSFRYEDGDLISIQYSKPTGTGVSTSRWMSMVVTPDDYLPQTILF